MRRDMTRSIPGRKPDRFGILQFIVDDIACAGQLAHRDVSRRARRSPNIRSVARESAVFTFIASVQMFQRGLNFGAGERNEDEGPAPCRHGDVGGGLR